MGKLIRWDGVPPSPRPYLPICSPRSHGGPLEAVVLSPAVLGVHTHYEDARTQPCYDLMDPATERVIVTCEACTAGVPRRWKGYLGGILARAGRVVLLEITAAAMASCPRLHPAQPTLRGMRIRLTRTGSARNGRVLAVVESCLPANTADLPPSPDVEGALQRIWFGGEV